MARLEELERDEFLSADCGKERDSLVPNFGSDDCLRPSKKPSLLLEVLRDDRTFVDKEEFEEVFAYEQVEHCRQEGARD